MNKDNRYIIYSASAGSGKTYTLVKGIVKILLATQRVDAVKTILAVTFTNKAANEMKQRILTLLKNFSNENKYQENELLEEIAKELSESTITIHNRAKRVLKFILHNYSLLSISTIDKFNLQLTKVFSRELGLSTTFGVEIDTKEYLHVAVDELINEVGKEAPSTEIIMNYISTQFENEEIKDIKKILFNSSSEFLKEQNLDTIKGIKDKSYEDFSGLKKSLMLRIKDLKKEIEQLGKDFLQEIENKGLDASDFYRGKTGAYGALLKASVGDIDINWASSYITNFMEGSYSAPKSNKAQEVEAIGPSATQSLEKLQKKIIRLKKDNSVYTNLIKIELSAEIDQFLSKKKEREDVLFISDINPIINNYLQKEPVAFIYEKLGGRYSHYFIDEFQDTSRMQWNNFLPIIEEALFTEGESVTLVGDVKQSIYRFRAGDPEILLSLMLNSEQEGFKVVNLAKNYRSAQNIVDFNNNFYQCISEGIGSPAYQKIFGEDAKQEAVLAKKGRVQISIVKKEEKEDPIADRVVALVQENIEAGYQYKDIVCLVRRKKEGENIVNKLLELNHPVITEESLLISRSTRVQSVVAFLRWLNEPRDISQLYIFLHHYCDIKNIKRDISEDIIKLKDLDYNSILKILDKQYAIKVSDFYKQGFGLYAYCAELFDLLGLSGYEDAYISSFLEIIAQKEKTKSLQILNFIEYWDTDGVKASVRFSDNINAVRIMTIHKSKGLEFPVVILPSYPQRDKNSAYWVPLEKDLYEGFDTYFSSISKTDVNKGLISTEDAEVLENKLFESRVDIICVNYVATTRPTDRLFIVEQENEKSDIQNFIQNQLGNEEIGIYELYPNFERSVAGKEDTKEEYLIQWKYNNWKNIVRVSTQGSAIKEQESDSIKYGNEIHYILSKIDYKEDIDLVLKQAILEGAIDMEEEKDIRRIINKVISHKDLITHFSREVGVMNERELMYDGGVLRPDRLTLAGEGYSIIDFKTGKKSNSHKTQVSLYAKAIEDIGGSVKEKLLVYLGEEVEVLSI